MKAHKVRFGVLEEFLESKSFYDKYGLLHQWFKRSDIIQLLFIYITSVTTKIAKLTAV